MSKILYRRLLAGLAAVVLAAAAGGQTLFYATSSAEQFYNTVEHVSSSGTLNRSVLTATGSDGVSRCSALAVDSTQQKIYFVDAGTAAIFSMNLDGSGLILVRGGLTATPTDIALDPVNQKIYYSTSSVLPTGNTIQCMDYFGNNNTVLFTAGSPNIRCTSLAVDTTHSIIIFADARSSSLWSVNLAGGTNTLVRGGLIGAPLDVALDTANQLVYYVTSSAAQNGNTVQKVGYTGSGNTVILTAEGGFGNENGVSRCTSLDFDPASSTLYLGDAGTYALWRLASDGSGLTELKSGLAAVPRHVRFSLVMSHFTVANLNDSGPGSLRQAILSVQLPSLIDFTNALVKTNSGTINLATVGDMTFGPSALAISNEITIVGPGGTNGIAIARSNGVAPMRLFYIAPGGSLSLENLTLTNGLAQGGAGGSGFQRGGSGGGGGGVGGAIFNWGTLDLENTTLAGNQALGGAGGGGQQLTNGVGGGAGGGGGGMSGNGGIASNYTTGGDGGGPAGGPGASGTSTGGDGGIGGGGGGGGSSLTSGDGSGPGGDGGFAGGGGGGGAYSSVGFGGGAGGAGGAGGFGGGASGAGSGTPGGAAGQAGFGGGASGLTDNTGNNGSAGGGGAGLGGAVFSIYGIVTVTNCTFSGNAAVGGAGGTLFGSTGTNGLGLGGGIFNVDGEISVLNATFAYNRADQGGGGIYNIADGQGSSVFLRNTIVAQTLSGASDFATTNISGVSTNLGNNNLIQVNDGFAGGIVSSADPKLGPLANNAGPTPTHYLLNGSPAINAGDNTGVTATDQRGYPRVADALDEGKLIVDLGAVEDGLVRLDTVPQTAASVAASGFKLFLTGETNRDYVLEFSTNFTAWTTVSTNLVSTPTITVFDTTAGHSTPRFYRARALP